MTAPLALTPEDLAYLEQAEALLRARADTRWCPVTPNSEPQRRFVESTEREVLYGGAAGGGKSIALLIAALQYVDTPGYSACLARRSLKDLMQPGGLIAKSHEWLGSTNAHWNGQEHKWTFPSGATLQFRYFDNYERDKDTWQGGEYHFIGIDELGQWTFRKYSWALSRLRRPTHMMDAGVPLRMRASANPGGVGHVWIGERWGIREDGTQDPSKALDKQGRIRPFIPARAADNPDLGHEEYMETLDEMDEVTRAQLGEGRWVQDSFGRPLPLGRANLLDAAPTHSDMLHLLCIDLGTSKKAETLALGVVGWSPSVPFDVYALHCEKHPGMLNSELAERVRDLNARWPFERMLCDEGALGSGIGDELRKVHGLPIRPAEKSNRYGYAKLLHDAVREAQRMELRDASRFYVVSDECEPLVKEAGKLFWNEKQTDMVGARHCYDTMLYNFRHARAWAAKAPPPAGPQPGTEEHARQWAAEHKRKVAKREADKRKRVWWQR